MGKKHRDGRGRRHGMSIAEALLAMQVGRWGGQFGDEARRRSRKDRDFGSAALQLVLLKLIDEQPRRGHELISAIAELSRGRHQPGPEIVYPTLTLLEDSGLIEAREDKAGGKLYHVTDAGRAELEGRADEVTPIMSEFVDEHDTPAKEARAAIKAAMRNLAGVLAQRMMAKGIDAKLLSEVAAIIDDAAGRISRL